MRPSNLDRAAVIECATLHAPLIAPIVASIVRSRNWARLSWPDLMQAGFLGLLEACHAYNPARAASFRTYASKRIEWAVLGAIRNNRGPLQLVDDPPERRDSKPLPDRAYELREALDSLSPRQRQVLQLRLSGYTQEMVAAELGISRVAVTNLEARALKHLRQRQHPILRAA